MPLGFVKAHCVTYHVYGPWSREEKQRYFFDLKARTFLKSEKEKATNEFRTLPKLTDIMLIEIESQYYNLGSAITIG